MSKNMKNNLTSGKSNEQSVRGSRGNRSSHEEVQRAIDGLNEIPDDELQEVLDDEFMEGLNVVDAWEGDDEIGDDHAGRENKNRDGKRGSRDRIRRDHRGNLHTNRDRDRDRDRERDRLKREDRKREEMRRDPSKSSQDIERDKMRAKRINESKILAEKEKAIKNLLDSDTVVPPGTEVEIIENEKLDQRLRRSRERRRSQDRHRGSPGRRRSHEKFRMSPEHRIRRSPFHSPDRRRSPDRHRKSSWERKASIERRERRSSMERHRRRMEAERDLRIMNRRSRSRERHRSRSGDRFRRWSRSPIGRRGSRRDVLSLSKSPPDRRRKRSPFINEIARQFRDEGIIASDPMNHGYMHQPSMRGMPPQTPMPMMNTPIPPPMSGPSAPHYMPPHPDPHGPPLGPGSYMPYDAPPGPPMNFEPMPMHPPPADYSSGPVMYNQPSSTSMQQDYPPVHMRSPQPVPAPPVDQPMVYPEHLGPPQSSSPSPQRGHRLYSDRESAGYNGSSMHRERLKTPEPPVISKTKPFEKTSLSSLLEASVSAKDTSVPVLYPGFKPEILRNCEQALRDLPDEDPRLKVQGRFFFDPTKEEPQTLTSEFQSNSILLQRNKNKILWEEFKERIAEDSKIIVESHPKYCQTEMILEDRATQTIAEVEDFSVQVSPGDLQPLREEKRGIMERLDGNINDRYGYGSNRPGIDLRLTLKNSSQRSLNRAMSPMSQDRDERNHSLERMSHSDRDRDFHRLSSMGRRDNYPMHRDSNRRSFSPREQFSPEFRRDMDRQDTYHDNRNERSREPSPMMVDDDDCQIIDQDNQSFSRDSNWRGGRGKSFSSYGSSHKSRGSRGGKHSGGRSFRGGRGGGGFRGK